MQRDYVRQFQKSGNNMPPTKRTNISSESLSKCSLCCPRNFHTILPATTPPATPITTPAAVATGKSGRYKYYKCTSRKIKGNHICSSGNLVMEKTDQQVLHHLAEQVFAPQRVQIMMTALRQRVRTSKDTQQEQINELNRQLKQTEERQHRLLKAIEQALLILMKLSKAAQTVLKLHEKHCLLRSLEYTVIIRVLSSISKQAK